MKSVTEVDGAHLAFADVEDVGLVCLTCGVPVPEFSAGTHKEWHGNLLYAVNTMATSFSGLLEYTSKL